MNDAASAEQRGAVPPMLEVSSLSKSFAGSVALGDFSLAVRRGEVHALLGENGSGKSTFIKILAGIVEPESGAVVRVDGRSLTMASPTASRAAGLRFVHQDLGLIESMSVADNLYLNRGFTLRLGTVQRRQTQRRAEVDLARVGLDHVSPRTLVGDLSPAERSGVAIARALRTDRAKPAKIMVFDEPTATLPSTEVERLMAMIRRCAEAEVGIVYVTHRLDEVFEIAHSATVLRDGRKAMSAPVAGLTRSEIVEAMVGSELEEAHAKSAQLEARRGGAVVLEVRNLRHDRLHGIDLEARAGEVVGIAGIAGSGRESLLGAVFGAARGRRGMVKVGGELLKAASPAAAMRRGVAYLPPDRKRHGAVLTLSARENLVLPDLGPLWRFPAIRRQRERRDVLHWFDKLNVRPNGALESPFSSFSGGNQQLVLLAKWLRLQPQLLLLDEPTQGVDVGAKARLHHHLLRAASDGAAVVVASSDADELAALCHRVLVLQHGRVAAELAGHELSIANISRHSLGSAQEAQPA